MSEDRPKQIALGF